MLAKKLADSYSTLEVSLKEREGPAGPAPCCAHLVVGYIRQYLGQGKERGWWQCTDCEMHFVPIGTTRIKHEE
jgi:hypothetical protein